MLMRSQDTAARSQIVSSLDISVPCVVRRAQVNIKQSFLCHFTLPPLLRPHLIFLSRRKMINNRALRACNLSEQHTARADAHTHTLYTDAPFRFHFLGEVIELR